MLALIFCAASALAGRVTVSVNAGGCGPRYYAPPVCYSPRFYSYYTAPVPYARVAPACIYRPAPAVYVPTAPAMVYRAPIVTGNVDVRPVSFGWRR